MKKLFAAFLLFIALSTPAPSGALLLEEFRKVSIPAVLRDIYGAADVFMEEFYVINPVAAVGHFLVLLNKSDMLEKYPATEPAIAAFMSILFTEHKNRTLEWLMPLQPHDDRMIDMLYHALWLAGRNTEPELAKLFARKPAEFSKPSGKLAERAVKDAVDIKMLWGGYLASGDTAYTAPVMDACAKGSEMSCAALKEFSEEHELVLRVLRKRVEAESDAGKRKLLETSLPPANVKLPLMDGDFGAHLVIADHDVASQTPLRNDREILNLPVKKKAKPGERAIFLLLFTGMELDENLGADLDFDIKVIDPKGNTVTGTEMVKQRVIPQKFRTSYGLHHHASFTGIYFKKRDLRGVYTVSAEIRDNRAKRKISLGGTINFPP